MKKFLSVLILIAVVIILFLTMNNQDQGAKNGAAEPEVMPISHASMILKWDGTAIYVDPSMYKVGEADAFAGKPAPDIVLITDIHQDHLDVEILKKLAEEKTLIITPMAVADMLPASVPGTLLVMKNSQKTEQRGFNIEAIPMYNLPESPDAFHPKGRGNGYIIEKNGTRVYVSGDTAGISEMRNLSAIDLAFIAMNLPYTMSVEDAAAAVLEFAPKKVYPYHYRTPEGFSDVAKFKEIINSNNSEIEVVQLDWY